MNTAAKGSPTVTLYDAFFPAIPALDGQVKRAEKFQNTWNWLWNKYESEPMGYNFKEQTLTDPVYDLNPEIIEAAYYFTTLPGKRNT